ncbi:hypothetical protein E2C01_051354 [Portunus trituberculatus]|uniref:Uncharacterized protein n=1 Tax=Portunus trituberculatus TaxID=210409 RepID=A0A5B7GIG9_PORTR|nr:hypothetical protein [Portunus trituberculatus]
MRVDTEFLGCPGKQEEKSLLDTLFEPRQAERLSAGLVIAGRQSARVSGAGHRVEALPAYLSWRLGALAGALSFANFQRSLDQRCLGLPVAAALSLVGQGQRTPRTALPYPAPSVCLILDVTLNSNEQHDAE